MAAGNIEIIQFEPDAARAARVDRRVRDALAESLAAVFSSLEDTDIAVDATRASTLIDSIRAGPVAPGVFGIYTDLVEFLLAEDTASAGTLIEALFASSPAAPETPYRIVTLDDRELGPGQAERYQRLIDDDENLQLNLLAISEDERRRCEALLAAAMALLRQGAPSLADEVNGLVREILLVASDEEGRQSNFQGGSTFYLWGALFLNAGALDNRVNLAVSLTHESAHLLLFGLSLGAKLVENSEDELFASPLRGDPRPMDGVVHALYVLARMIYCQRQLLSSDALSRQESQEMHGQMESNCKNFRGALETIEPHARFTHEGAAIFERACSYMSSQGPA